MFPSIMIKSSINCLKDSIYCVKRLISLNSFWGLFEQESPCPTTVDRNHIWSIFTDSFKLLWFRILLKPDTCSTQQIEQGRSVAFNSAESYHHVTFNVYN